MQLQFAVTSLPYIERSRRISLQTGEYSVYKSDSCTTKVLCRLILTTSARRIIMYYRNNRGDRGFVACEVVTSENVYMIDHLLVFGC